MKNITIKQILPPIQTHRIEVIDVLRGLAMILMALDHSRFFFTNISFSPTDLAYTSPALFFTRWITHFCAPVFIFLIGTSMFFYITNGKTKKQASLFLLTRGLWMIVAEFTLIHIAWSFNLDLTFLSGGVIWVIGMSMLFLSILIFLPKSVILLLSLTIIFSHNLLDGHETTILGIFDWLHSTKTITLPFFTSIHVRMLYVIIPWIAVPALGYVFGSVFLLDKNKRNKYLWILGLGCLLGFMILRYTNLYGDPDLWSTQQDALFTLMSFLNVTKYPPSLLYLLLTLSAVFLFIALVEPVHNRFTKMISIYGKVPFFYYVLHLFLIHGLALIIAEIQFGAMEHFTQMNLAKFSSTRPYGHDLPLIYFIWISVIVILYPACKWYANFKRTHKQNKWLSYI